jgi:hypothetical protein
MATQYSSTPTWQRNSRAQDWAILILGIWLFISPWALEFAAANTQDAANGPLAEVTRAAWNAWILGAIVFLVGASAIGRMEAWQEYISMVLGAWIFIAPWVLGFSPLERASWDHWIVGALIFLIALWSLSSPRTQTVTTTAAPSRNPPVR